MKQKFCSAASSKQVVFNPFLSNSLFSKTRISSVALAAGFALGFLPWSAGAQNSTPSAFSSTPAPASTSASMVGSLASSESDTVPEAATEPVPAGRPAAEPAAAEIAANPGRPALATSALLTPQGYVQVENGVLFASGSAEFANRVAAEETMRFTVTRRLQLIVAAEPVAFSAASGAKGQADSTHEGDVAGGFQTVLKAGVGWRPTIGASYIRRLRGGSASDLDMGGFTNSAVFLASADFGLYHVDANGILNEQTQGAVRRAQWIQAVAVSHPVKGKLGATGEARHFTEPFNGGPGWAVMAACGYSARPSLVLDFGVARGLTGDSTHWQVASGFTYVMPRGIWGLTGKQ